jgi:flagellar basal body-associated protein FliL
MFRIRTSMEDDGTKYVFAYSNMVLMIGGQLLLLAIAIFIIYFGNSNSMIGFPEAATVKKIIGELYPNSNSNSNLSTNTTNKK